MVRAAIQLTDVERAELDEARRTHPMPYVREHAAGVLKVADGMSYAEVARTGLLNTHDPDTISDWCRRYKAEGLSGLLIREGRGRKPAFSPSDKRGGQGKR